MKSSRRTRAILNPLVIAVTIVFVALSLLIGRDTGSAIDTQLRAGQVATQDFVATRFIEIEDIAATDALRAQARAETETVPTINQETAIAVRAGLAEFFSKLQDVAFLDPPVVPDATTTTSTTEAPPGEGAGQGEGGESTTTAPPDESAGQGEGGETTTTITTTTTTTEPPTTTTTTIPRRDLEDQFAEVEAEFSLINDDTIQTFVGLYNDDLDRVALGEDSVFPIVEAEADALANRRLAEGISARDFVAVRMNLIDNPPPIFIRGLPAEDSGLAETVIAQLVAASLQPNEFDDLGATELLREENADSVPTQFQAWAFQELILGEGEFITSIQLQAINDLGLIEPEAGTSSLAVAALGAIAVLLAAFFLWSIARSTWREPRHFALLGVLLVLAAVATRIPEVVAAQNPEIAYMLPAVMFGYLAAILYDPRTAVLLAAPIAIFTAISTADPALTMYATGATVLPVAFVSSVSSRRELRVAIAASAAGLAPLAGATAWLFTGADVALEAAGFAALGGVVAGLVAQGLLSFLENLFGVTTTLTLLDLTDRNHPALRLLEDKAPGTFNHSILVGTLAGKAARAIDADPLLAQAAAYYHDLGKTENPQYFIENQFGVSNPHDELEPEESSELIRAHVRDGLMLARRYRIPHDVADGIEMHHGTGLMRYFYHKAMADNPGIEPAEFRHHGVKPKRKEMAILMISDSIEGAARALAQNEDPTGDSLRKLVETVVGEKLDDGQLDESELTFGDLTKVKDAIVLALVGYYHTRIPYPGFPGPRANGA